MDLAVLAPVLPFFAMPLDIRPPWPMIALDGKNCRQHLKRGSRMSIKDIWLKILSGQPLTEAEELAWHNHWINPRECLGRAA